MSPVAKVKLLAFAFTPREWGVGGYRCNLQIVSERDRYFFFFFFLFLLLFKVAVVDSLTQFFCNSNFPRYEN